MPGVVTINVVAVNGAQSFSPNPATLPAGQMVVWHNVDNITHHVAFNDRSVDTGDLAPGASSQPMAIAAAGGQYLARFIPRWSAASTRTPPPYPPPVRASIAAEGHFNHVGADAVDTDGRI
jgi:hypothetical protein